MNETKKRNIIIGSLCAVLLLMVVGYAAFQSVLKIKGTSSISSNWDIKITSITEGTKTGSATTTVDESGNKKISGVGTLTASVEADLVSPGDSIEYDITVTNSGSLNAKLEKITLSESNNPAIKFETSGLTEGDTLTANGGTATLKLKITYDSTVTTQPENTTGTISVTLDYVQADENGTVTPSEPTAADKLIETTVTTGDGLYQDEYEEGRYIYKGSNPNNYITFNNETWRILSVENDGTLKIMRKDNIGAKTFDSKGLRDSTSNGVGGTYCATSNYGCNAWSVSENFVNGTNSGTVLKDAELNTYLNNDYYNTLNSESQNLIQPHKWGVGPVTNNNTDLSAQIVSENGTIWNGRIGMITVSEFLRANTNTEQCGDFKLNNTNKTTCKKTNYIVPSTGYLWIISPCLNSVSNVFRVYSSGYLYSHGSTMTDTRVVYPIIYLIPNITLSGEGTEANPYTIVS